jgi:type II secretory pathway pseudopilin PulG
LAKSSNAARSGETGSTLIEVIIAMVIMGTALLTMAQLFALSTGSNVAARNNTFATVLAEQKLEQLRSLTWGFDPQGLPLSDFTTDTSVTPEAPGGMGLQPSPATSLRENTVGYVDHVTANGDIVGNGTQAPNTAVYTRRWSVEPLPTNPNNTLILHVLVTTVKREASAPVVAGPRRRYADDALIVTVKTRKAK